jgi:hypothetical protein
MSAIDKLGIVDYRAELRRAGWTRPNRTATRSITIHYNGPPVKAFGYPAGERAQLQFDAIYHMRPNVLNADGIQYHAAVLSDGGIYWLRNWLVSLWHCGNAAGNAYGLALHLPLGGNQRATDRQLAALGTLVDALRADYGITFVNVKPHSDWKATECCGDYLSDWLRHYRAAASLPAPKPVEWFITTVNAYCRTAPDVGSPAAELTPAGTRFAADAIIENGAPFRGEAGYAHRADQLGFYHLSVIRPA